jgi:hypothetical protein
MGSLRSLVVLAALAASLGAVAPALAANADYDGHNGVTLRDAPWTSASAFIAPVQSIDNSTFGEGEEVTAGYPTFLGCGAWGARTAWVRFVTGVAGRVFVTVGSQPGHDVMYKLYTTPRSIPPGSASMTQLDDDECHNGVVGAANEDYSFGHGIGANRVVYVQVLTVCANRTNVPNCSADERAAAPGGPITLSVRFHPTNTDGDSFADTLDGCPTTPGSVGGCPDRDGDGKADRFDACPTVKGKAANGCRLPDEDGDGFRTDGVGRRDCNDDVRAINPDAREIKGNVVDEDCDGLAAYDRDGDGFDDAPGPDCDPGRRDVNPKTKDKPGNKVDEDCDGRDAPFPRVRNDVAPQYLKLGRRIVGFASFKVLSVKKGMRVRIECRGARCPYAAKTYRAKKARSELVVGKEFRTRVLPVGASVTVKLMRRGFKGRVLQFTLRKTGKPKIRKGCLKPGSTRKRVPC